MAARHLAVAGTTEACSQQGRESSDLMQTKKPNVETQKHRGITNARKGLAYHRFKAHDVRLVAHDDAQALLPGPVKGAAAVERPANAYLGGVLRQNKPLFQGPVKRRAVVVGLAVITGNGVAVRVKMQQSYWPNGCVHGAQVGEAYAVVAAQDHGQGF